MEEKDSAIRGELSQSIDFSDLIEHIPVGICKFLMDSNYTLLYGNQCFYKIFSYTQQQFKTELKNEITKLFLEEERSLLKDTMSKERDKGNSEFHVEHRVRCRDGNIMWVLAYGNFIVENDEASAYAVIVDITERKNMEEQLRIDEERFRLALAQTDNTIFDYDINSKVMIHAEKSAGMYGLTHKTYNVPDYLVEEKVVHPDSAGAYLEMYRQIRMGAPSASCIIQAKTVNGQYAFRRIRMTNIFDQSGKAVRAVGMLEDIDEQTRREEHLLECSQRDLLTGLYNKGTTENKISKLLESGKVDGALFLFDVDCFKTVNDHYGHLFGDFVLSEIAHRTIALCRQDDVVGRIGGDEFIIYLPGKFTEETVLQKAEEICHSFDHKFISHNISADIKCSIGLVRCPDDGASFEMLYQKADIALYQAKSNGKNSYCLYHPTMNAHMKWVPYSSTKIDAPVSCV